MMRRGFTLLEILISTALVGLIMVGLYTLMFSMTELWGVSHPQRIFDQHVTSVTTYLNNMFRAAGLPPAAPLGSTTTSYSWTNPLASSGSGGSAGNNPLFTFTLPAGSRLFSWQPGAPPGASGTAAGSNDSAASREGRMIPDVICSIEMQPGVGLLMLWHSQYETTFLTDAPRETLISPLVTNLEYDYFDPTALLWSGYDTPQLDNNGDYMVPNRLRLTFTYGKLTETSTIPVWTPAQGLPPF